MFIRVLQVLILGNRAILVALPFRMPRMITALELKQRRPLHFILLPVDGRGS